MPVYILAIESSCDDTSAAVFADTTMLSNIVANQQVHKDFGGVVPELASRAHQQNIIPVISKALATAKIDKKLLQAVAFTRGPGLLGSLLVGTSFAKAFAMGLDIPLIEINHLQAHVLAHFIQDIGQTRDVPKFPFLCLTVSGGHTQIVLVRDYFDMEITGQTIDDAAGETFDKAAKILGLPYPGGPFVDKNAKTGKPVFTFAKPLIPGLNFSFSGLKTSFLYFLRDKLKEDQAYIEQNMDDLCASIQKSIIDILIDKLLKAAKKYNINEIAIAGGVSANSGLRDAIMNLRKSHGYNVYIPQLQYTTDNAAMIAVAAYFKFLNGDFANQSMAPYSRGGI
jgi:N6-L-threonylcarbamoyladenine synthase